MQVGVYTKEMGTSLREARGWINRMDFALVSLSYYINGDKGPYL